MSDTFGTAGRVSSMEAAVRKPFCVSDSLQRCDEKLNMLIARANNVSDRLLGPMPENPQAVAATQNNLEYLCGDIEMKFDALANLIARIDNAI